MRSKRHTAFSLPTRAARTPVKCASGAAARDRLKLTRCSGSDILDLDDAQLDAFLHFAEQNAILPNHAKAQSWRRAEGASSRGSRLL